MKKRKSIVIATPIAMSLPMLMGQRVAIVKDDKIIYSSWLAEIDSIRFEPADTT